ncbi:MAG: bifunctional [glutamate--ammonia ligase]-adenylyl-L-tyrosine phosphorylase/[glutamate--ammonia-ligase] adenylyltransferase [Thermodesulfobacteriota bacterium]
MAETSLHGRSEILLSQFAATEREALLRDPDATQALSALAAYSPALIQTLSVRLDVARWLFLEGAFKNAAHLPGFSSELSAKTHAVSDLAGLQSALRLFRQKELARLAVRDLTGRADLAEVMTTLSELADVCLDRALETAVHFTARRLDPPARRPPLTPVILGMGKLGARELNYSSDVDLIYLYRPEKTPPGGPTAEEAALAVFTLVTRAMSEVTENGLVFRVDLNLRPGGKDGALAQSLDTALKHYLNLGRPWERLALLKARPVAGDLETGRAFLAELTPFVLRRHLDYTSLEEIRDLKERFTRENEARLRRGGAAGRRAPALNVKLSPGGIREIEFFVQALSLTFGGRLPHLRQAATLEALAALAEEGLITREDREDLSRAYVFLRTVEHRLQLRELTQTQTLPRSPEGLRNLALSLGFDRRPEEDFTAALTGHLNQVKKRFNSLLAEPEREKEAAAAGEVPAWVRELLDNLEDEEAGRAILEAAGFSRPQAALAALRNIRQERFLPDRLSRYGRNLERLLPHLVAGAAGTPDPDRSVLHLERFLGRIGPRAGFFVLLEENPRLIGLLSTLFGSSDHLSSILINHPDLLDSFIDRRSARVVKDKAALGEDLGIMLGAEEDPEPLLTVIRRFKNDETLRVGLYDLLDQLTWPQVTGQLTDLAETVMERTMRLAQAQVFPARAAAGIPVPLAVMGLGKLGGRELSYGSDLDLLFVLDEGAEEDGVTMVEAVRLAQRFISYLSVYLEAGPGYAIDSRLRPSGTQGPLVVTPGSFERYHRTSQLWERQALLKMRRVLGPEAPAARVAALAVEAIYGQGLPEDAARRIDELRQRMSRERGRIKSGTINLKFSPGGLVDAEFLTQYLQLRHGREAAGPLRSPNTLEALAALAQSGLAPVDLAGVGRAYEFLGRTSSRLSLIYNRWGDRAAYTEEEMVQARLPEMGPSVAAAVRSALEVIHGAYEEVFRERGGHAGD